MIGEASTIGPADSALLSTASNTMEKGPHSFNFPEAPATQAASDAASFGLGLSPSARAGYSQGGTVDDYPSGEYKCNKFTYDSYSKGAGVPYPTYEGGDYPYVANTTAERNRDIPHYPVVDGPLKVGDLLAFPNPNGHGHVAIYAGNGRMIEAQPEYGVTTKRRIRDKGNWQNMVVRRYTP